jgi:hypothetical protein
METTTLHETQRALLLQLRDAVNSREEFEDIERQLARFAFVAEVRR